MCESKAVTVHLFGSAKIAQNYSHRLRDWVTSFLVIFRMFNIALGSRGRVVIFSKMYRTQQLCKSVPCHVIANKAINNKIRLSSALPITFLHNLFFKKNFKVRKLVIFVFTLKYFCDAKVFITNTMHCAI